MKVVKFLIDEETIDEEADVFLESVNLINMNLELEKYKLEMNMKLEFEQQMRKKELAIRERREKN